jgi:hypothetical protein
MRDIIEIDPPSIKIQPINIAKVEGNDTRLQEYMAGQTSPLVEFAGNYYSDDSLLYFKLTYGDSLLPEVRMKLADKSSNILVDESDRSSTVKVYIRSNNPDFNPIIAEFIVESGRYSGNTYEINGTLLIPEIDDEIIRGYEGTSYDVSRKIAKELGLGFSSNVTQTQDNMKWLRLTQSAESFLDEIRQHSWRSEKSFIGVWVDPYYVLNFFDYGEANDIDPDDFPVMAEINNSVSFTNDKTEEMREFILTNHRYKTGTPNHINSYIPFDNTGLLEKVLGFERTFMTQDVDSNDYYEYSIKQTLLEESLERSGKNIRTSYVGFTSENAHRNYDHAVVQNNINGEIYTARGLKLNMSPANTTVYCGMIAPIIIINTDQTNIDRKGGGEEDQYNKQLSGNYVIGELSMTYEPRLFSTDMKCFRIRQDIK